MKTPPVTDYTRNLVRHITSLIAERTQYRPDLHFAIRQHSIDQVTDLTLLSVSDGTNQLTTSVSLIRRTRYRAVGMVEMSFRTNIGTDTEDRRQALVATIDSPAIPLEVSDEIADVLDSWMTVSSQRRTGLAVHG